MKKTKMMKNVTQKFFLTILLATLMTGCGKESSSTATNTSTSGTNPSTGSGDTGTGSGTPASCPWGTGSEAGISTNGQSTDYYTIPYHDVIMHGASTGVVTFNSQLNLSGYNGSIFKTDSRFHLRVIPHNIGKGTDSKGNTCTKQAAAQVFSKMNVGIVVRAANGTSGVGSYHFFQDIPIDCASQVFEFDVPATSDPLVIEVLNTTDDQDCLEDQSRGITSGRNCPYTEKGSLECYALDIQFATDTTKDIPH